MFSGRGAADARGPFLRDDLSGLLFGRQVAGVRVRGQDGAALGSDDGHAVERLEGHSDSVAFSPDCRLVETLLL